MSQRFTERKISHRILEELGAHPEDESWENLRMAVQEEGFAVPEEPGEESARVIIRKADPFPILKLLDKLRESFGKAVSGHTDFFVFARLGHKEIKMLEDFPEVDRVYLDEQVSGFLEYSVETVKAKASWNTFQHYGEDITWAVVDSGINDLHPHFTGATFPSRRPPKEGMRMVRFKNPTTRDTFPAWWHSGFTEREWFSQLQDNGGQGIRVEPGFPGNTVVLRLDLMPESLLHPHGSHIAGIIAGQTILNGQAGVEVPGSHHLEQVGQIYGIAPQAKLVDIRVLDQESRGQSSDAIKALFLIRKINEEAGRVVIAGANLSLGYPYNPWDFGCGSSPLCEEVDRLVYSGVLVVAAAGNSGYAEFQTLQLGEGGAKAHRPQSLFNFQSISDPGNAREAITVGSTHRRHPRRWGPSFFSSKGPTGDGRLKPDLLAPGEKITSCHVNFAPSSAPPLLFLRMSGTSQAAAQVSGALALFLSIHPEFIGRPLEVKEKLLASCTDLKRERYHQGHGLLDIFRLVQSV
jgi:serine protease AprX